MKNHHYSVDFDLISKLPEIKRQHIHIPKNYTNVSPLRNKQNILKTLKKSTQPVPTAKTFKISPLLNNFYQKIIEKCSSDKENTQLRSLSVQRTKILSSLHSNNRTFSLSEQEEAFENYKIIQNKVSLLTRNKLPASLRKFK
jgi:hypothetical protein